MDFAKKKYTNDFVILSMMVILVSEAQCILRTASQYSLRVVIVMAILDSMMAWILLLFVLFVFLKGVRGDGSVNLF